MIGKVTVPLCGPRRPLRRRLRLAAITIVVVSDRSRSDFTAVCLLWLSWLSVVSSRGEGGAWSQLRSVPAVFVVAADPELPALVLIAPFRRPVEEPVVGHQELHPATGGRVRLVDGLVLERESGEAEQFGHVPVDIRAGLPGIAKRDWRQVGEHRLDRLS